MIPDEGGSAGSFDDVLARSSPAAREFDRRLRDWADEHRWSTRTTAAARQLFAPDGRHAVMSYPGRGREGVVEVSLRPFHLNGRGDLAEQFRARLEEIAGEPMGDRQPHVPVPAVLERWGDFSDRFLPDHLDAHASVEG